MPPGHRLFTTTLSDVLASEPLLAGVRVLDLCDQTGDAIGRLLADLGADVIKVEPPGGSAARRALPTLDGGVSIPFALHNANKRTIVLDPADTDDRRQFLELAGGSDIVVDSGGRPGWRPRSARRATHWPISSRTW